MIPLSGELARGTQARGTQARGTQARGTQVRGTQVRGAQARGTQVRGALAARDLALMAMFAAVTAVLAYVRIPLPFSPVPITGQTFGLMLAGLLLGPRLAALSQAVYLLMGLVGLPVFAGGMAGPGVLAGPTGGYLWAHVPGAYIVGLVAGSRRELSAARAVTAAAAGGIVAVYVLGVWQLGAVTGMDWRAALAAGALPFLPGDALKAAAAAVVGRRLTAALGRGTFRRNAAAQEPHPRTAKGFGHDFPRR